MAAKYMKLAGYPSGRYAGGSVIRMVAASTGAQPANAQIVNNALTALGFRTHLMLVNFGQVDDPQINAAIASAALAADASGRAQAWAAIDRQLVQKAVAVPETFNSQASIESSDVAGVNQMWNGGAWDLDFSSLK